MSAPAIFYKKTPQAICNVACGDMELTSRFELPNLFITNEVLYLLSYVSMSA